MKNLFVQIIFGVLLFLLNNSIANAAISVPGPAQTWATTPVKGDWLSYLGTGSEGTILDQSTLNVAVNSVDHAAALEGETNPALMTDTTGTAGNIGDDWYSRAAKGRHNTTEQHFQFALGGDGSAFSFLQARARNQTGSTLTGLLLSFDLSVHAPSGSSVGPLPGVSVYYSTSSSGAAGSWIPIFGWTQLDTSAQVTAGQSQNFATTLDLSGTPVAPGSDLYIRWAVDNATGDDVQYRLDNMAIGVPEPSTSLFLVSVMAAFGFVRHRSPDRCLND